MASPGLQDARTMRDADATLDALRSVVSGGATIGYSAEEFMRCIINPRDMQHLDYWLQCEGAEDPHKLMCNDRLESVTALILASQAGWEEGVEKLLTSAGVHTSMTRNSNGVDLRPGSRTTPLIEATKHNHVAIVQLLVQHGAKVNQCAFEGNRTALDVAVLRGHPLCAKFLLQNGARPTLRVFPALDVIPSALSDYHSWVCDYCARRDEEVQACMCTPEETRNQQLWVEVIELMFSAGFKVGERAVLENRPLLSCCIRYRNCAILRMLIQAGLDVDFPTRNLEIALVRRNAEAVRLLIQGGVNTNVSPRVRGRDPRALDPPPVWRGNVLALALRQELFRISRYLVEAGVEWTPSSRVQLVVFMRSKRDKVLREHGPEHPDLPDLEYLANVAFRPRSLLELTRGRLRRDVLPCLKPRVVRRLPLPTSLHDYILCKDMQ